MDYSIILVILSFENKIIIVKYIIHFDEIIDRGQHSNVFSMYCVTIPVVFTTIIFHKEVH